MNRMLTFVVCCLAVISCEMSAFADEPAPAGLSVDLVVESKSVESTTSGRLSITEGTLTIRNTSDRDLTVAHPRNRWGVSFLVLDSTGAVVLPIVFGKSDPIPDRMITIKPKEAFRDTFRSLSFVCGSGLEQVYTFQPGQTYRVTTVYRPSGPEGPSVTVSEKIFKVPPESK